MVGWCEIAEYRSLSYTYFSKEKIETGFHLFLFLLHPVQEMASLVRSKIVIMLRFLERVMQMQI